MRRPVAPLAVLAALVLVSTAAAALQPVRRDFGELSIPRVRAGPIEIPKGQASGRVRVLVRLQGPPLAAWAASPTTHPQRGHPPRRLAGRNERRLDVREPAARRYLALLTRRQAAAAAEVRRAIPSTRVGRRFRIVLNALTVEVPFRSLARLRALPAVVQVYPSLRYTLLLNGSPGLIGATAFSSSTGARGEGVKIAVVDDGVDPDNPFFDPGGFGYPEGFPRGDTRFTTPKIIVARSFPAPGTPRRSALAFDKRDSFHGTHVAGIAAGNAGTTAPTGDDHPATAGLSGIAPRAWIGNYRVFSVPSPIGNIANTPEIVAAFERAVLDGMDVINFSGGGAETEPANDALIEAVANVAAAGVVPVIAAGNDRDEFGTGTVGSPGTAPDAIAVAAVSNTHVYAPALSVEGFAPIPHQGAAGKLAPTSWAKGGLTLVDVGSIQGTDGRPVERHLCAPGANPNASRSTLPAGSLRGAVALVSRGFCTFVSKARRARLAGAVGIVLVDNRSGEANPIPVELLIPGLMIADLDGAQLRRYLASRDGRAAMRAGREALEFETGRGGVVTSFSSAGPTGFGHALKPDVAAPGGQILSSTRQTIAGSPFAVFDGTSMATPHVAGAVALLRERHPEWSPTQVKSALVSTAKPAWADTSRTVEAPVYLAGGGLVDVDAADDPKVFAAPTSLSLGDLNVNLGATGRSQTLVLTDAGGGAGRWTVEVRAQAATPGAWLDAPDAVQIPEGGSLAVLVSAKAAAGALAGEGHGFLVLRREDAERRIPFLFEVTRPELQFARGRVLRPSQAGSTKRGFSAASVYRFPGAPFGPSPNFGAPAVDENGAEDLYVLNLDRPVTNFGVVVESSSPGSRIDPFVLGSPDENHVQGLAGIPVNVNPLTSAYRLPNGAAGATFPRVGRYYVAVDSGRDAFSGRSLAGRYRLRSWIDDLTPPTARLETRTVGRRRPMLAARFTDRGAGVDPLSLSLTYGETVIGATRYDPVDGLALFPIPENAPPLQAGRNRIVLAASDYQESKNVQTVGSNVFPNTASTRATVVVTPRSAVVSWLSPAAGACARRRTELLVSAEGPRRIRLVRFLDGERTIGTDRTGPDGLFSATWRKGRELTGRHRLRAVAVDAAGNETSAARIVRVCR